MAAKANASARVMARRGRPQFDQEQFYASLSSKDALTVVLRGHLSLEAFLNGMLDATISADLTELYRLRFAQRVDLAIALGLLAPEDRAAWRAVNDLRNRFAHDIGATVSEDDARHIFDLLPPSAPGVPPYGLAPFTSRHRPAQAVAWFMTILQSHANARWRAVRQSDNF